MLLSVVVEVSCLSCEWAAKVKAEVCVPGICRHCLLLEGRLAVFVFVRGLKGLSLTRCLALLDPLDATAEREREKQILQGSC